MGKTLLENTSPTARRSQSGLTPRAFWPTESTDAVGSPSFASKSRVFLCHLRYRSSKSRLTYDMEKEETRETREHEESSPHRPLFGHWLGQENKFLFPPYVERATALAPSCMQVSIPDPSIPLPFCPDPLLHNKTSPIQRVVSAYYFCKRKKEDQLCASFVLYAGDTDLLTFAKHWGNYGMRQASVRKGTSVSARRLPLSLSPPISVTCCFP